MAGWIQILHAVVNRPPNCPTLASHPFDTVLALAVVHHLAITEGIPLELVLSQLARMSRRHVLVEYVGPNDPQFQRLRRGRNWMLSDLTEARFVELLEQTMRVVRRTPISGLDRTLFLAEKRMS